MFNMTINATAHLSDAQLARAWHHSPGTLLAFVSIHLFEGEHLTAALTTRHQPLLAVLLVHAPVTLLHLLPALGPPTAHEPKPAHLRVVEPHVTHAHAHAALQGAVHEPQVTQLGHVLVGVARDDGFTTPTGAWDRPIETVVCKVFVHKRNGKAVQTIGTTNSISITIITVLL